MLSWIRARLRSDQFLGTFVFNQKYAKSKQTGSTACYIYNKNVIFASKMSLQFQKLQNNRTLFNCLLFLTISNLISTGEVRSEY